MLLRKLPANSESRSIRESIENIILQKQEEVFANAYIYIMAIYINTLAHDEQIKFLEKALPFLVDAGEEKYPRITEGIRLGLSSLRNLKELQAMFDGGSIEKREPNEIDKRVEKKLDDMVDMLLDMSKVVKEISMQDLKDNGAQDIAGH